MTLLILGLVIFLGVHSTRVFAEGWRTAQLTRLGEKGWKGAYTLASLVGLVLLVWGYGLARQAPVPLWTPVIGLRHLGSLLTVLAFILLAAAYVPRNSVKARVGHPMVAGVKVWALAHLLANHTLADLLLFGGFLVWAVLCFRAARARDRAAGTLYPAGTLQGNLLTVGAGLAAWAVFAMWLHGALIGVRPFG
ncbi:MAG: NnrU family protein [Betaproteobacteria bacterium]